MVVKKKIISELQKYNKDLEKHLPNVDFSFLEKIDTNSKNSIE